MEIQLESPALHAIQSYSESSVTINQVLYQQSLIVTAETIETTWPIHSIKALTTSTIQPLLAFKPEIILIAHSDKQAFISPELLSELSKQRIGIECMMMGPACRTFNVLLSEHRSVAMGIILDSLPLS